VGIEPGSSRFHLFSHFRHLTAEPQRLPNFSDFDLAFAAMYYNSISVVIIPSMYITSW
jgi:hypothetical protein